jgi:MoxR-like ATPase
MSQRSVSTILTAAEINAISTFGTQVPVPDNVIEYAVKLANKTRPQTKEASTMANEYLEWGAGPRASQYLVLRCQM